MPHELPTGLESVIHTPSSMVNSPWERLSRRLTPQLPLLLLSLQHYNLITATTTQSLAFLGWSPGVMIPLPPINPVPIYDVHRTDMGPPNICGNTRPSLPPRKLGFRLSYNVTIDDTTILGFTVSVPLKQHRHKDIVSQGEIAFEWEIPFGDFYDHICARMNLDLTEAVLGYKFETDAKKSIICLPSDDLAIFDAMLEKVKSHIACARTCAVVLEIHNLVRFIDSPTGLAIY